MKTFLLALVSFPFLLNFASAQGFNDQHLWETSFAHGVNNHNTISGYVTDRQSFRMNNGNPTSGHSTLVLEGWSGTKQEWKQKCSSLDRERRFNGVRKIILSIQANPWASEGLYRYKKADGSERVIKYGEIENAAKVLDVRVAFRREHRAFLSQVIFVNNEYAEYVAAVTAEMQRQFNQKKEEFMQTGELTLDLTTKPMDTFACDLSFGGFEVFFEFDVLESQARVPVEVWMSKEKLTSLLTEVKTLTTRFSQLKTFQAGIVLGQALSRVQPDARVFEFDRDGKLLRSLFKKESSSLVPEQLSEKQVWDLYRSLNAPKEPEPAKQSVEIVDLDRLNLQTEL